MDKALASSNRAAARERDRLKSVEVMEKIKPGMRVYDPVLGKGKVLKVHRMQAVVEFPLKFGGTRIVNRPGHCLSLRAK